MGVCNSAHGCDGYGRRLPGVNVAGYTTIVAENGGAGSGGVHDSPDAIALVLTRQGIRPTTPILLMSAYTDDVLLTASAS
jgi:hypothetical protein